MVPFAATKVVPGVGEFRRGSGSDLQHFFLFQAIREAIVGGHCVRGGEGSAGNGWTFDRRQPTFRRLPTFDLRLATERRALEVAEERVLVAVAGGDGICKRQARALGAVGLLRRGLGERGVAERDYLVVAADAPVVADALQQLLRLEPAVLLGGGKSLCGGQRAGRPTELTLHHPPVLQRIALDRPLIALF